MAEQVMDIRERLAKIAMEKEREIFGSWPPKGDALSVIDAILDELEKPECIEVMAREMDPHTFDLEEHRHGEDVRQDIKRFRENARSNARAAIAAIRGK